MESVELLGIIAGSCTTSSYLPQIIHIIRYRSVKDISLTMYLILVIGILLWLIYGFIIKSPSIIGSNIISLLMSSTVIVLKLMWKKK